MKYPVKKCCCGIVTDPFQLEIVEDTWVKDDKIHFEYKCPYCKKKLTITTDDK